MSTHGYTIFNINKKKNVVHRTLMPPPSALSKIGALMGPYNGWKTRSLYRTIPEAGPTTKL